MKRKHIFFVLTLIVGLSTRLLLANMAVGGYKVGDKVKDFSLKSTDGKEISLAKDFKQSQGVIVVFTCNHCPFSQMYEDRIIGLDKKYASKGYPVVAINPNDGKREPDDSFEAMKEKAKSKNYSFPYVADETQAVAKAFGAAKTPHVFILKRTGGDFVVEYIGAIDDNANDPAGATQKFVEQALDQLIAGLKVQITSTKAIGCSIKWKEG